MSRTAMDSPALQSRSEHYPEAFEGRVPLRVRVVEVVRADPFLTLVANLREGDPDGALVALPGQEYEVWVNRHGAVALVFPNRTDLLGVTPDEFEVIAWHEGGAA